MNIATIEIVIIREIMKIIDRMNSSKPENSLTLSFLSIFFLKKINLGFKMRVLQFLAIHPSRIGISLDDDQIRISLDH